MHFICLDLICCNLHIMEEIKIIIIYSEMKKNHEGFSILNYFAIIKSYNKIDARSTGDADVEFL